MYTTLFLSKLLLALLLAPTVLTSPVDRIDVEITRPAQASTDLVPRDPRTGSPVHRGGRNRGHGPWYYRPNFDLICEQRGYTRSTLTRRRCTRAYEFTFRCTRAGLPLALERDVCSEGYFCIKTKGGGSLEVPEADYTGSVDVLCVHSDWSTNKRIDQGDKSGITALSASPYFRSAGHMYGTIQVYGLLGDSHPNIEWEMISPGISKAIGDHTIQDEDADETGLFRVYSIEANYEDSARFAGLVKGLTGEHGISVLMVLAWFPQSFKALEEGD